MTVKINVLIVDDDIGISETMKDIFEDFNIDVDVANDGYQAIELIGEKFYDLAFLDIKMPGIDGVETLKRVRNIRPFIKIVMMTAYSVEELIKEALDLGVDGILYKPFDIEKIINFMNQTIKKLKNNDKE